MDAQESGTEARLRSALPALLDEDLAALSVAVAIGLLMVGTFCVAAATGLL